MMQSVTVNTERNEVIKSVMAELASFGKMMGLQIFRRPANLASPAVSFEYSIAERPVCLRAELESRLFLPKWLHALT
jgi:hypothetical protein